jgi:hypothetical protein
MYIPARNIHTGSIMYWVDGETARRALSSGREALQRQMAAEASEWSRLQAELEEIASDRRAISRLSAAARRVPGVRAAVQYMVVHGSDVLGRPAMPAALADQERLYSRIQAIQDRHVDDGDATYYHDLASHERWVREQLRDRHRGPTGDAYTASVLARWPADRPIDDQPGYVLEDGRRFATAREAERAEDAPQRQADAHRAAVV